MLKVRIIPTLLLRNQRMVKGKKFADYRDTGDPIYASRVYNSQYVDELAFLDIDATEEGRSTNFTIIEAVARECFMPLSIGGGISTIEQIRTLLQVGADKVIVNSAATLDPDFVRRAADSFGSQCIVVGVDVRYEEGVYRIYRNSGKVRTELILEEYLPALQAQGAGELFLNCIDRDGTMSGYDLDLLRKATQLTQLPIIACGGAGNFAHLVDAIQKTEVRALAMASIYHFGDNNPIRARAYLKNNDIPVKVI